MSWFFMVTHFALHVKTFASKAPVPSQYEWSPHGCSSCHRANPIKEANYIIIQMDRTSAYNAAAL